MPIIVAFLAVILAVPTAAFATDSSKPGDPTFPIELTIEKLQDGLTFDNAGKAKFRTERALERLKEIQDLIASGRAQGLETAILNLESNSKGAIDAFKALKKSGTQDKEILELIRKSLKDQKEGLDKVKAADKTDQDADDLIKDANDFLEIEEDRLEALEDAKEDAAEKLKDAAEKAREDAKEATERAAELKKEAAEEKADQDRQDAENFSEAQKKQAELSKDQAEDLDNESKEVRSSSSSGPGR